MEGVDISGLVDVERENRGRRDFPSAQHRRRLLGRREGLVNGGGRGGDEHCEKPGSEYIVDGDNEL